MFSIRAEGLFIALWTETVQPPERNKAPFTVPLKAGQDSPAKANKMIMFCVRLGLNIYERHLGIKFKSYSRLLDTYVLNMAYNSFCKFANCKSVIIIKKQDN